ncbi:MAG: Rieske (2Fe-2S) protein [Sphingomonadaceae bacterium]
MDLTPADRAAFAARTTAIDYPALDRAYCLGSYARVLPVSLTRMIENAYDWEHLPFVHPLSFAAIALLDEGEWGWRAKVALPSEADQTQLIELLVDREANAWVTTVIDGPGSGLRIHTVARALSDSQIVIDVRFLLPERPDEPAHEAMILGILQTQYTRLYDEDEALMVARQEALDQRKQRVAMAPSSHDFGAEATLDRDRPHLFTVSTGRFVLRHYRGRWVAHAAVCPHMLGPLSEADIGPDDLITCPWHGYRFALADGAEHRGRCGALAQSPKLALIDEHLIATA